VSVAASGALVSAGVGCGEAATAAWQPLNMMATVPNTMIKTVGSKSLFDSNKLLAHFDRRDFTSSPIFWWQA
jgi:hypothetical protein